MPPAGGCGGWEGSRRLSVMLSSRALAWAAPRRGRRGWAAVAGLALAAGVESACAQQTTGAAAFGSDLGRFALAGVAVLVASGMVQGLRRTLGRWRTRSQVLRGALATEAMRRAAMPMAVFDWPAGQDADLGASVLDSVFLDRVLGPGPHTLPALRARLVPESASRLDMAMARLAEDGASFRVCLRTVDSVSLLAQGDRRPATRDMLALSDGADTEARARLEVELDQVRAERDRLTGLLDAVPLPVWHRQGGELASWGNRAYRDAVGAGAIQDGLREIGHGVVPADSVGRPGGALAEAAWRAGSSRRASHHVVVGGHRRLLEINECPLPDDLGQGGFALDLTALEETQRELAEHIGSHAEVLSELTAAIEIYGANRRLKFFNTAFLRLFQLEDIEDRLAAEPDIGTVLEEMRARRRLPETADFPGYKRERAEQFTSVIEPTEHLLSMPDGTFLRQRIAPHPMGGLLFTYEDITDRLTLQASYELQAAVQRATLDNLFEGVAVFGADARLKLCNPVFSAMWGVEPDLLSAEPHVSDLIERTQHLFDDGGNWPDYAEWIMTRVTDPIRETGRMERADGMVLDYATIPLPDARTLFLFTDVTGSVRAESALRERNRALEKADLDRLAFIADLAGALRLPLHAIHGASDILASQYFGRLTERQREYADAIARDADHVVSIIDDIQDMAVLESGDAELDLSPVPVAELLRAARAQVAERPGQETLVVETRCEDSIGPVFLDRRRLEQALALAIAWLAEDGARVRLMAARHNGDGDPQLLIRAEALGAETDHATDAGIGPRPAAGMSEEAAGVSEDMGRASVDASIPTYALARPGRPRARPDLEAREPRPLELDLIQAFIGLHGGTVTLSQDKAGPALECRLPILTEAPLRLALTAP